MELESLAVKLEEENDKLMKEKVMYTCTFRNFSYKLSMSELRF